MKIQKLVLQSPNLANQRQFYSDVLGFEEIHNSPEYLQYQIGETLLVFEENEEATPYHFAFNIPSNQIDEALEWLRNRAVILKNDGYEIQNFNTWFAQAIYCYDADQNIIEFIARENIRNHSDIPFSASSVLSVSEIGIVSENNIEVQDFLEKEFKLPVFKGVKDVFSAIGDDHGLFICMDRTKRLWFPTSENAFCSEFEAEFVVEGQAFHLKYHNRQLQIG